MLFVRDADGDGRTDLVLAGYQDLSVALKTSAGFTPFVSHELVHYVGDDGDLDLALGTPTGVLTIGNNKAALPGDLDRDGRVAAADVDLLCQHIQQGETDPWFDLNTDGRVNKADLDYMIESLLHTVVGDINLDGVFDSNDFVLMFQIGEYEDDMPLNSLWSEGDLNCDGDFTTADLVWAFQKGGYSTT